MKVKDQAKVITAIIALLILETIALLKGLDGALFFFAVSLIAGLGGFALGKRSRKE